jgi:hypothetical protein
MSYTYTSLVAAIAVEMEADTSDSNFQAILPTLLDDGEQRLYRELDLLASIVTVTGTLTANNRLFALPTGSGHILVVESINIIDGGGTRHPLTKATRDGINFLYPTDTAPSSPSYPKDFARIDDLSVMIGPAADQAYTAEIAATIRPAPISAANPTTFLSSYLSDLLFAAVMISAAGYMREFGSQADDPKMAVSWESQFQEKLASAKKEELRKSYALAMSTPPAAA